MSVVVPLGIVAALGMIFVLYHGAMLVMYPNSFVIPDVSVYPNDIWFSASTGDTRYSPLSFVRSRRSYTAARWEGKEGVSGQTCPFGAIIDGKEWKAKDFELAQMREAGAVDIADESAKMRGKPRDPLAPPTAQLDFLGSDVRIFCNYNLDGTLFRVKIHHSHIDQKGEWVESSKEVQVVTSMGTVTLPADHSTLVRHLGQPLKHVSAHTYYTDHSP